MGRQHFERPEDLEREGRLARGIADKLGLTPQKLSDLSYGVDYMLYEKTSGAVPGDKGVIKYLIEIKTRTCASTAFSHYMISYAKLKRMREQAADHPDAQVMLAVWFTDAVLWCRSDCAYLTGVGERAENRDGKDLEPMVFIPLSEFTRVPECG